jgi:hypothetical protein
MNPVKTYFQVLVLSSRASWVGATHGAGVCRVADVAPRTPQSRQVVWRD